MPAPSCRDLVSEGGFYAEGWRWEHASACAFAPVHTAHAKRMLANRSVLFFGTSVVRRQMYRLAHVLLGRRDDPSTPNDIIEWFTHSELALIIDHDAGTHHVATTPSGSSSTESTGGQVPPPRTWRTQPLP